MPPYNPCHMPGLIPQKGLWLTTKNKCFSYLLGEGCHHVIMPVERKSEVLTVLGRPGQFSPANLGYVRFWNDALCAGFPKPFYIFKILPLMSSRMVTPGGPCQCLFKAGSGNVSVLYPLQTFSKPDCVHWNLAFTGLAGRFYLNYIFPQFIFICNIYLFLLPK